MFDALLLLAVAGIAYYTHALDGVGSIAAFIMAYAILRVQGMEWVLLFLTFFLFGVAATGYRYEYKKKLRVEQRRRSMKNVVANGLVAFFMALVGNLYGFVGAVSAATADTMSSEVGMLSKQKPVLLISRRTVPIGTNGGISALGNTFSILGSLIIGALSFILFKSELLFLVAVVGGIVGSLVDSALGEMYENKKRLNNAQVNILATLFGAVIAIITANVILAL